MESGPPGAKIMGILNITPNSFSDGGKFLNQDQAIAKLHRLMREGADIIDIGGESTKPHSSPVTAEIELNRVRSVIDYIFSDRLFDRQLFSIDTYKHEVAEYALAHGFKMVNDITSLAGDEKMIDIVKTFRAKIVIMYNSMVNRAPQSKNHIDIVLEIKKFLKERVELLIAKGIDRDQIIIDPGMGAFISQSPIYSFEVINRLSEFKDLGCPILVGPSRKLWAGGNIKTKDERSVELSLQAIENGASIIRIHNVRLMRKKLYTGQ